MLSTDPKHDRIFGVHLRFIHDESSGWLSVVPSDHRRVTVDSVKICGPYSQILPKFRHIITIGSLQYRLEWANIDRKVYTQQVQQLRQHIGLSKLENLDFVEITPQEECTEVKDFLLQECFYLDESFMLHAALHRPSGSFLICKRITNSLKVHEQVQTELAAFQTMEKLVRALRTKVVASC